MLQGVHQVPHPRRCDRQRPAARNSGLQAQAKLALPPAIRCLAAAFSASSSAASCADPMCSMSRDPRRDEHTTCTAVAPDAVLTVRTYGTRPPNDPD